MKKVLCVLCLLLVYTSGYCNPIYVNDIEELYFDEDGNWFLEIKNYYSGQVLEINSTSGSMELTLPDSEPNNIYVISSKEHDNAIDINPEGDLVTIGMATSGDLAFGNHKGATVQAPLQGQSISSYRWGYGIDSSPTIGYPNDLDGEIPYFTIMGKFEIPDEEPMESYYSWRLDEALILGEGNTYETKIYILNGMRRYTKIYKHTDVFDYHPVDEHFWNYREIVPINVNGKEGDIIDGIDIILKDYEVGITDELISIAPIQFYPNPVKVGSALNYKIDLPVKTLNCQLQICNVEGKVLSLETISASEGTIDIANSSKGDILIVNLLVDGKVNYSTKVIVE